METDKIINFAKTLEQNNINNSEIINSINNISELFKSHYLSPLHNAIESEKTTFQSAPTKEVALINAIARFTDENKRNRLQKLSNVISSVNTFSSMYSKLEASSKNAQNIYSISSDEKIEPIDENAAKSTQLLILLAMTGII